MAGHSSVTTTLGHYTHVRDAALRETAVPLVMPSGSEPSRAELIQTVPKCLGGDLRCVHFQRTGSVSTGVPGPARVASARRDWKIASTAWKMALLAKSVSST